LSFTGCESFAWYGDFKGELEKDTSTEFYFYSEDPRVENTAKKISQIYKIDTVITKNQFPMAKFSSVKPGYHVESEWKCFNTYEPEKTGDLSYGKVDFDENGYVSTVKVEVESISFYSNGFIPNTDTPYTVEAYLQPVNGDTNHENYVLDKAYTKTLKGTTDTQTNATASAIPGFTAQAFEQVNINGTGNSVVKIYYDRNTVRITLNHQDEFHATSEFYTGLYGADFNYTAATGFYVKSWILNGVIIAAPNIIPAIDTTYVIVCARETASSSGVTITVPETSDNGFAISAVLVDPETFEYNFSVNNGYSTYEWYIDGEKLAITGSACSAIFNSKSPGVYQLLCVAVKADGTTVSASLEVTKH